MLKKYREIKSEYDAGASEFIDSLTATEAASAEIERHAKQLNNDISSVNVIISDIDKQFYEKTKISNPNDQAFLWFAVAVQCVRWLLVATIDEKLLTPTREGRYEASSQADIDETGSAYQIEKARKQDGDWERVGMQHKYVNNKQIMLLPVPFDAMNGTKDIIIPGVTGEGKNISGTNHHSATLGHDPILGQIFGTANILTRSISFHDAAITTRRVANPSGRTQIVYVDEKEIPPYCVGKMVKEVQESLLEDKTRLRTALIKENLHLQSDKYTKMGLPIPLISPSKQQELLKENWNSKELETVLKTAGEGIVNNFLLSTIINTIVGTLHGFCYNAACDESRKMYEVRTRKIVATSNVIAESINLLAVAGGAAVGLISKNTELTKKAMSHLDLGGYIEAIHQIFRSQRLQEQVRREFLEKELHARLIGEKYSFLEESYYEQKEEL